MRKLVLLTTILISSLLFAGCGSNTNSNADQAAPEQTQQAQTTPEATQEAIPEATTAPAEAAAEASPAATEEASALQTQQQYLQKLDDIQSGLADLQPLQDEGTTTSMSEAAGKEYERWDTALNDIYSELKQQLAENEMAELKKEQLDWIAYRDDKAKKASLQYEGGTMEALEYTATLASVTKERCYELVEKYMK